MDYEIRKKKEMLLSQMHHDIKTPLNGITGLVYLMRQNLDHPEKMEEYLEKLERAAGELERNLEAVFALSSAVEEGVDQEGKTVNLKGIAASGQAAIREEQRSECEDTGKAVEQILLGKTVLVAEDNEINLTIVSEILESWGCRTVKTWDGMQAVKKFTDSREGEFDCILMDIRMPYMNGYEAAEKIRSMKRADAQRVVIIALTANAYQSEAVKIKEAGMNGIITKPLHVNALRHLMWTLLKDEERKA